MGSGQSLCCNNNDGRAREYKISNIQRDLMRQENLKRIQHNSYGMLKPTKSLSNYHSDNTVPVSQQKREGEKQLLEMLELTEQEKRSYNSINKKIVKHQSFEKRKKRSRTFLKSDKSGTLTPPQLGSCDVKALNFDSIVYIDNRNDESYQTNVRDHQPEDSLIDTQLMRNLGSVSRSKRKPSNKKKLVDAVKKKRKQMEDKSCDISVLSASSKPSENNDRQEIITNKFFSTPGFAGIYDKKETPEFVGEESYLRQQPIPDKAEQQADGYIQIIGLQVTPDLQKQSKQRLENDCALIDEDNNPLFGRVLSTEEQQEEVEDMKQLQLNLQQQLDKKKSQTDFYSRRQQSPMHQELKKIKEASTLEEADIEPVLAFFQREFQQGEECESKRQKKQKYIPNFSTEDDLSQAFSQRKDKP